VDTVVLVDGSNMWYRCYVATQFDKPGFPVYAMTRQIRKLCFHYGRDNVVVCWDAGRSGRKKLDPGYKAKRVAAEGVWEDLIYMKRMLASLGVKTAIKDGFEADDVIGTLAEKTDSPILIHSTDKDFYQLITDRVRVLRPRRKTHGKEIPEKIVCEGDVVEEFGCSPLKTLILKAFRGDASDNIPKIPLRFTKKFKECFTKALDLSSNVEEFYSHVDLIDDKYKYEVITFKDRALLNEKLVTIMRGLDVSPVKTKMSEDKFLEVCKECEIKSLKFSDWTSIPKEPLPPPPVQRGLF
jgi:DNA polymerase I